LDSRFGEKIGRNKGEMIVEVLVDHTSVKYLGNLACERNLILLMLYDTKYIGYIYISLSDFLKMHPFIPKL